MTVQTLLFRLLLLIVRLAYIPLGLSTHRPRRLPNQEGIPGPVCCHLRLLEFMSLIMS
jgi:hypothetical protein